MRSFLFSLAGLALAAATHAAPQAMPVSLASSFSLPVPTNPAQISPNSFYRGEVFSLRDQRKGTCLYVKDGDAPLLVTRRCQDEQPFDANSRFAFHWVPTLNNHANLAIMYNGKQLCAVRKSWRRIRFYPCNEPIDAMAISLGVSRSNGSFQLRDAKQSNSCFDTYLRSKLHMEPCRKGSRDQRFTKFHIGWLVGGVTRPMLM